MPITELRRAWTAFRRPLRLTALAAAALAVIALGLLYAFGVHSSCPGTCPAVPVARDGSPVADRFAFWHRGLGRDGSITVRLTAMTGTITYPPPDHDRIVSGLVPWAKAGIIIKDGVRQGSPYAALMMTGRHGVRFQHDYRYDTAGRPGRVSPRSPRWLRLTRSGDVVTGAESADGRTWHTVGTARLPGLPDTVRAGLFATSPGDLTLRRIGLGGSVEEVRFAQAVGVFDHVSVTGGVGGWTGGPVGRMNETDWERFHHASGAVVRHGVVTVSGTGDIGPISEDGSPIGTQVLSGLVIALVIVLILAARFGARTAREAAGRAAAGARAAVLGGAVFGAGLVAAGTVLPASLAVLHADAIPTPPLPALTAVRVTIGVAAALALAAVLTYGLAVRLRRGWAASLIGLTLLAVPYTITAAPLLPDTTAEWLLRVTPAAAFAVQQLATAYPQVTAHYAPSSGYYPLPAWAGLTVLATYTALALHLALRRRP